MHWSNDATSLNTGRRLEGKWSFDVTGLDVDGHAVMEGCLGRLKIRDSLCWIHSTWGKREESVLEYKQD